MSIEKGCLSCGKTYIVKKPWQKYCSSYCKCKAYPRDATKVSQYNEQYKNEPLFKYHVQKNGAKRRGIDFLLTFEQWWNFWKDSWNKRGKGKDALVMCRYGDTGPYSVDNIYMDSYSNNSRLASTIKTQQRDTITGRFVHG
jgi:hypothetical protein